MNDEVDTLQGATVLLYGTRVTPSTGTYILLPERTELMKPPRLKSEMRDMDYEIFDQLEYAVQYPYRVQSFSLDIMTVLYRTTDRLNPRVNGTFRRTFPFPVFFAQVMGF